MTMLQPVTVEGGGARVTLHPETNRTRIYLMRYFNVLQAAYPKAPDADAQLMWVWARLCAQGRDVQGLPYPVATPASSDEDIVAAFEAFAGDTNTAFGDALISALLQLDRPLAPPEQSGEGGDDPNAGSGAPAGKGASGKAS